MPTRHRDRGFTLIELIVVVIVIGVLATLATVTYNAVIDRSDTEVVHARNASLAREVAALVSFDYRPGMAQADVDALFASAMTAAVADLTFLVFDVSLHPELACYERVL